MDKLKEYSGKRTFDHTPEPAGTIIESAEKNRFVIQKHDARREHYDLRLQVGDVLVSWAVPKQPVDDPAIKRLAIKVEDHPLSYIHFEGTIPKGQYGAGTVMVWDIGYYYINDSKDFPAVEAMQDKIRKGSLKLYLQGAKLKGFYILVEQKSSTNNEWFFMKARPSTAAADLESNSALSGRSMEEIAQSGRQWGAEKAGATREDEKSQPQGNSETMSATKTDFPGFIHPMLATLTGRPFSKNNWLYELKLDGYRVIACKKGDETELFSRNNNSFTKTFPAIAGELSTLKAEFVIDGEVCSMDNVTGGEHEKRADFQKLQDDKREQANLHYYVFDILWINGHDVTMLPLRERKKILNVLLADPPPHIHYLDHVEEDGVSYFERIARKRHEGMIAKRAESRYFPGIRSKDWLKVKTGHQQEMVVCGYLPSEIPGRPFSSLLCAVYEAGSLVYTGRVGTGFNEKMMDFLIEKLQELETDGLRLENAPSESKIRWLRPQLIAEVKFAGWTHDGIMRHASFIGLRSDKQPEQIQFEQPVEPVQTDPEVSGSKVRLTNPSKIFWPDEGYTKADVIAYYRDMAETILPYLKDRPQSLYRTPNGIVGKGFFQKNVKDMAPDWVETIEIDNSRGGTIEYLLCQDKDTLLYMANLGCIEINPWSSSKPKLDHPDYMIFDLDPVEIEFNAVVNLAKEFKKLFDQLGIPAYCKTSGSRGLHVYVPVQQKYTYAQVRSFVKFIEAYIHNQNKELTSFERSPEARKGKVYLDYLQNGKGKTMASVYSIRPRPGAMVSAPVSWDELDEKLDPRKFTLATMRRRLERKGDLWQGILDHRIDMKTVLAAFAG